MQTFDVIVIGLGHAGCEAALACARVGLTTAGITLKADRAAVMSCNPAIGGTAKGHLVRELDALGGEMARAADLAGTHFLTLNASKGAAVRASRVLCDREAYARAMQATLAHTPHLSVVEGEVSELVVEGRAVKGVRLMDGREFGAKAVVVTTGTFLHGLMHVGTERQVGGRLGDVSATGLSGSLKDLGFELGRFKTGTPARLLANSIDWARCTAQPGDATPRPFSLRTPSSPFPLRPQVHCAVTHTTLATHEILRANLGRSAMFSGNIVGRGPRYCPSLEDKVVRFASRERHTVFLEPEGIDSPLVYPAGLSTSMPADVQLAFLRTIPGLEQVAVERFGYAVEYDYSPPTQLRPTLETKRIAGLFFAGQLNGTSGYEEAAVQGLMAGLNASLQVRGEPELVLDRREAHLAVLLDDLTTRGVDEPMRMLTSRSEHRLALREGNAEFRLREHGHRVGLVNQPDVERTRVRARLIVEGRHRLEASGALARLRRPEVRLSELGELEQGPGLPLDLAEELETSVKYEGYIRQAEAAWARNTDLHDDWRIPLLFDWSLVPGLSTEAREKLARASPESVKQARRVPGVTPAAIGLVLVQLKRLAHAAEESARSERTPCST